MRNWKPTILGLLLGGLILVGCSISPAPTTPRPTETMPRRETPTASPLSPSATPEATRTFTPIPPSATPENTPTATATPPPMTAVKEENGWVTYRNEIVGYEISVPNSYRIKGSYPAVGHGLLGPAVPDEEIAKLAAKYYGESLYIWMIDTDSSGKDKPWRVSIYAYDIIFKNLGMDISPGGIGDYELAQAQETLTIDGQAYEVRFTVLLRSKQAVQELGILYLENGGVEFMFGFFPEKDDPAAYQAYRKDIWPVMRQVIESYRYLPMEK